MRIAIGSDHAGFDLKEVLKSILAADGCQVSDLGAHGRDSVDYTDYAEAVGYAVRSGQADRGILLCGSGVGASMAANRIRGVRAGLCHDTYSAHQGVEHDDMNVLVLGGRVVGVELARELIRAFLNARFSGDARHVRRLAKLTALESPLRALAVYGQSVWLDHMRRSLITSGELLDLVEEDNLSGVTSNPSIFEKAISGGSDYQEILQAPGARALDAKTLYERLAIRDIRDAADVLRPVYDRTAARDGYVSLEVAPSLAYDTDATFEEGRRLWNEIGRPNAMIKVPATPQGIAAIEQLIAEGINVNATLLFDRHAYAEVVEAYISGIEQLVAAGGDPRAVSGTASFFVGRIDSALETIVAQRLAASPGEREQALLRSVDGRVAIANAKLAYDFFGEVFSSRRWRRLADIGAQTQRLLWASTGAKNPAASDVVYVEELIGPDTITTLPPATLDAFRDHGRPRASLLEDTESARDTMTSLTELGIDLQDVTDRLLAEGVRLFATAFEKLLDAVEEQSQEVRPKRINRLTYTVPASMGVAIASSLADWQAAGNVRRLWQRDPSLWSGRDEGQWLGWLGITDDQLAHAQRFHQMAETVRAGGFSHVLLLGMGGSSLGPEVIRRTFGTLPGFPELHILDSTDPAQIKAAEAAIDISRTLFIVSSKSGATLEPNIFKQYFYQRVVEAVGRQEAGNRFVAITDPHSKMQHVAEADHFRRIFFGWPNIGGRYSVLSDFGLVPAAAMGVDVAELLDRTGAMVNACTPSVPIEENPGVVLGTILGVAGTQFGRDKVTIISTPGIDGLGAWLEQLIAESTGKDGKGLIPIDHELTNGPGVYGTDRLFVFLSLASDPPDPARATLANALERAGHPIVRVTVDDPYDLGQEFFRWEMATAVAGAIMGIDPFDQPDVEASKTATRRLTTAYEERGTLPEEAALLTADDIRLFTDPVNAAALSAAAGETVTLESVLGAHLRRLGPGDYFALLAYLEMNEDHRRVLQAIRDRVLHATHTATCLEFGPRFLHSTGQAYKGGPNSGVFLQITCDDPADLMVPGQRYSFGTVKAAQARGDFEVLAQRGRRALRAHLGRDLDAGLSRLLAAVTAALERKN